MEIKYQRIWTKEQTEWLIDNYGKYSLKDMVNILDKTESSIYSKVNKLKEKGIKFGRVNKKYRKSQPLIEYSPVQNADKYILELSNRDGKVMEWYELKEQLRADVIAQRRGVGFNYKVIAVYDRGRKETEKA